MSKRIDLSSIPSVKGTGYPSPHDVPCRSRERQKLGDVAGLTQFGVNRLKLPPGSWSSQRHWHEGSDEFVLVLEGEVTLVSDEGDELLVAGQAAGFKAGVANGHCLQNRSNEDVYVLEIGSRLAQETAHYSDIDMVAKLEGTKVTFTKKDGSEF